jgi:hypothetical protein
MTGHDGILFAFDLSKQLRLTYCQRENMVSRQRRKWQVG